MATAMETTTRVRLPRDAAAALVKEARERFENGAHELHVSHDEGQRATIAACTEIIGLVAGSVGNPWRWPHTETPHGRQEEPLAEFEFSAETMAWIERNRDQQGGYVADFESGACVGAEPGYYAGQVFLLHVLEGILTQRDEAGA